MKALIALKFISNSIPFKGHHLLVALLLFFQGSFCFAGKTIKLDSLSARQFWLASQFLPGSGQIINKQYWKVPVFYAGMGSMLYLGSQANQKYHSTIAEFNKPFYGPEEEYRFKEQWTAYRIERNIYWTGAAVFYAASVADALIVRSKHKHSPTTATVLSMLVPGMGQVYNQKLWKVPVVFGGIASLYYVVDFNQRYYKRLGIAIHQYPNDEYGGRFKPDELKYWRDSYRRNRDLSIISLFGFYLLNIIDANVDAHFFDWDISDNLALKFEPMFDGGYLAKNAFSGPSAGFRFSYKF